MIELISIHIPKTGGTSFYQVLQQVYGNSVSKSYKRRDYLDDCKRFQSFEKAIPDDVKVLHGHLYFREIASLRARHQSKVICWLRDPVERVISNYLFFKAGLQNPKRNPANFQLNKHRVNETLAEYAAKAENRNRMFDFLEGISLKDIFFFGFLFRFDEDLKRLGQLLDWPEIQLEQLNKTISPEKKVLLEDTALCREVARLNALDHALFQKALAYRGLKGSTISSGL